MHPSQRTSLDLHGWLVEHDPLPVRQLSDPSDSCGFDARSAYVGTYWLAILGPTCVLLARRLVSWLEVDSGGFEVSLAALAGTLGLGSGLGRNAAIVRSLARLADFGIARVGNTYDVRATF